MDKYCRWKSGYKVDEGVGWRDECEKGKWKAWIDWKRDGGLKRWMEEWRSGWRSSYGIVKFLGGRGGSGRNEGTGEEVEGWRGGLRSGEVDGGVVIKWMKVLAGRRSVREGVGRWN